MGGRKNKSGLTGFFFRRHVVRCSVLCLSPCLLVALSLSLLFSLSPCACWICGCVWLWCVFVCGVWCVVCGVCVGEGPQWFFASRSWFKHCSRLQATHLKKEHETIVEGLRLRKEVAQFQTMILVVKKSSTMQETNWTSGGPQRCLAKSQHQPTRTVQAGGDFVQEIGLRWQR